MGKTKIKRNNAVEAPEFRASHRFAKMSPQKARLVMDMIRGLPVSEALDQLRFSPKRSAFLIDKVLKFHATLSAEQKQALAERLTQMQDRMQQRGKRGGAKNR